MTEFPSLDTVMTPDAEGAWHVPDGWQQGRGAFGGIVVGAMLRAVQRAESDAARTVRSVTAEIVGAVQPGLARVRVETVRRGNAVSTLRTWIEQGNETMAHAVVVLGADRPNTPTWRPEPPALPSPEIIPAAIMPAGIAPVFAQHFEFRPNGPLPYTASKVAETSGYVFTRGAATLIDAAYVAAHVDAYWLAAMPTFDVPRPAATVAFSLHLQGPLPRAGVPLFHRGRSESSAGGYASELRELFTPDGELLTVNQQLIAIIK